MELTESEGKIALLIARDSVESYVRTHNAQVPTDVPPVFHEKRGVFVTLEKGPNRDLRGCIGFPEPVAPLIEALVDSAVSACSNDPRFPPVKPDELHEITVEVSVLTPPKLIEVDDPRKLPSNIKVGRDGLIVRKGYYSGLLLPQVATEWGWDSEDFLSNTCRKAGLPLDDWMDPKTKVYSFQAQIFSEKTNEGH